MPTLYKLWLTGGIPPGGRLPQPVGQDSTASLKAATRTPGHRLPQPVGRDSAAPLKAATGTQGSPFSSPSFLVLAPMYPGI